VRQATRDIQVAQDTRDFQGAAGILDILHRVPETQVTPGFPVCPVIQDLTLHPVATQVSVGNQVIQDFQPRVRGHQDTLDSAEWEHQGTVDIVELLEQLEPQDRVAHQAIVDIQGIAV
jgi:hypothetical protein